MVRKNGQKCVTQYHSLQEVEDKIGSRGFYRLNRQLLVNFQAIISFEKCPNRKLGVRLHPDYPEEVIISRYRSPEFKRWFLNLSDS